MPLPLLMLPAELIERDAPEEYDLEGLVCLVDDEGLDCDEE